MIPRTQNAIRLVISIFLLSAAAAPTFAETLKSAVILGSATYASGELFDLYGSHLGETVDETTAANIADALRQRYLDDGYARPGYTILDNGLGSGIVRIQVSEARISRVEFEGDAGPYSEALEGMFAAAVLGDVLRPAEVRDVLKRSRRLRGLDISIRTVADSDSSGVFLLQVQTSFNPVESRVRLSNYGTEEIDRNLLSATFAANGLFGRDTTAGAFLASAKDSRNYRSGGAFLSTALGSNGTTLQLLASSAALKIDSSGGVVEQSRDRYHLKLARAFSLESGRDVSVWAGVDLDNLDIIQDDTISREDRLRGIEAGFRVGRRSTSSAKSITVELELGINGLGGRVDNFSNPDEARENNYAFAEIHYMYRAQLAERWGLRWDVFAQHSPHDLPTIKRFKVGGNRIGRGFEAAAVSGDRGFGNRLELKRRTEWGPSFLKVGDVFAFYDLGSAWRNDSTGRESAASTGIGAIVRGGRFSATVELARPLTHDDADGNRSAGLFFEIVGAF